MIAYSKAQAEMTKVNAKLEKYQAMVKSGVPGQMGPAVVEMSKITAKLGPLHKKVSDAKKKMDDSLNDYSKVAPAE